MTVGLTACVRCVCCKTCRAHNIQSSSQHTQLIRVCSQHTHAAHPCMLTAHPAHPCMLTAHPAHPCMLTAHTAHSTPSSSVYAHSTHTHTLSVCVHCAGWRLCLVEAGEVGSKTQCRHDLYFMSFMLLFCTQAPVYDPVACHKACSPNTALVTPQ